MTRCTRGADPPHPNCSSVPAKVRFALALYGSVSGKRRHWNAGNMMRFDHDTPASAFVDVNRTFADLRAHVMTASGGARLFDTFIHNTVPSMEVRARLIMLFKPTAVTFYGSYARAWSGHFMRLGRHANLSESEVSRLTSMAVVLRLVAQYEAASGHPYERIFLARPDVWLWQNVDLRRYCDDRVYRSNCDPPYHTACLADLHYVMTSSAAAAFSTVDRHLNEFAFGSRAVEDGGRLRGNLAMGEFVLRYVGLPLVADHIVIERHEEVSRKAYFRPSAESQTKACASDMLLRGVGGTELATRSPVDVNRGRSAEDS